MQHQDTPFIDRIVALHGITLRMADQFEEAVIYRIAVEEGLAQLDFDRLAIFLLDENDATFMCGTWGTDEAGYLTDEWGFRAPIEGHDMVTETLAKQDIVTVRDPITLYNCDRPVGEGWNAMVAMWQGTTPLGWLNADNLIRQRPFTEEDREVLKLLAASIGQMIRRVRAENRLRQLNEELEGRVVARTRALAEANHQLEVLARTDPLTGLANRREFDEALYREWHRALRYESPISLLLLDVDYFKQYNDTLGHAAGDECLKVLAAVFQSVCKRATDICARIGGEEFVVLLPDTYAEEAQSIGQALLTSVREADIAHPDSSVSDTITVSAGLVTAIPREANANILQLADEALYRAKHRGRNRLEFSELSL